MAMLIASRRPSLAMPNLARITTAGTRAASSVSKPSEDKKLRNSRPSDRLTVITGPEATKESVIRRMMKQTLEPGSGSEERAAVILASPRHASWLNDKSFMASLVSTLKSPSAVGPSFHVLAAVVDGLSPRAPSRELREGLSILLGGRDSLLPGLWDETSPGEGQPALPQRAQSESSSSLSILLPRNMTAREANRISLTLPLANTLFQNGRRSTLLASEWAHAKGTHIRTFELARIAEKHSQVVDLPSSILYDNVNIRAPLVPITQPRKVLEGLGNILAKVEIDGEPSPASKELQINIPRLLESRRTLSQSEAAAGRVGVWAIIYPKYMFGPDGDLVRFYQGIGGRFLGTALGKMAFDLSTDPERVAWETQPVIRNALFQGARLHRILSGGGEWGAKASLLSLDPQTSHGRDSEEAELDKFIRSFHNDHDTEDAIAKPGDYVQFFIERDPVQLASEMKRRLYVEPTEYPPVLFGVGDMSLRDIDPLDRLVDRRRRLHLKGADRLTLDHFGGYSAEGIYLSAGDVGPNTKLDVPGASVNMTTAKGAVVNGGASYAAVKRIKLTKKNKV